MRGLFDMDGPLMNGLGKLFDCILLSLSWITACLPILTIGAACGALYRACCHCIRSGKGYALKTFWTTFRENIKEETITWIPILLVMAFLFVDAMFMKQMNLLAPYLTMLVLLGVACVWAAYCTAYRIRFNGTLGQVLWNNLFLVLSHPLLTLTILLLQVLGAALVLMVPYMLMIVPAAVCLLISFPMETVFLKHMPPDEAERFKEGN